MIERQKKANTPSHKSNSLAALPCKLRFTAKHLLFSHRTLFDCNSLQLDKVENIHLTL
jgi:hypothetical protein